MVFILEFMSLMDLVRIEIVGFLGPDASGVPGYFWVAALAVIMISALVLKRRGRDVEGGIMDQI